MSTRKRAKLHNFIFNIIIGALLSTCLLMNPFVNTSHWLEMTIASAMEELMLFLSTIINWLMDVPAGLKLNKQLTEFLGRFFMYHIYLWNSIYSFVIFVLNQIIK
jgi:phosphatidylinositol glycan class Q protein